MLKKQKPEFKNFRKKRRQCVFPGCNEYAIESHIVAKRHLRSICDDGHVISPIKREKQYPFTNEIGKVGITSFPVMTLYCTTHDDSLFANLENMDVVDDDISRALLHRIRHFELQKKLAFVKTGKRQATELQIQGLITADQANLNRTAWDRGIEIARKNAKRSDELLISRGDILTEIFEIDLPPVVCAAGAVSTIWDLNGKRTVRNFGDHYCSVSLYCYHSSTTRLILVGEHDDQTAQYLKSFRKYPKKKLPSHLLSIIFWATEDVFVHPDYYSQLPDFYIDELTYYVSNNLIKYEGSRLNSLSYKRRRYR